VKSRFSFRGLVTQTWRSTRQSLGLNWATALQAASALTFALLFYYRFAPSDVSNQSRAAIITIASGVLSLLCVFILHLVLVTPNVIGRQLEEELQHARTAIEALESRRRPKLDMVLSGKMRPYYQEYRTVLAATNQIMIDRRFRVGIQNLSSVTIKDVRVIIESCEPATDAVFPGHALQVMGAPEGTERFDCAPSDTPTGWVDVVFDKTFQDPSGETQYIWIAYAISIPNMLANGTYTIRLRAEGENTSCTKSFVIEKDRDQYTFNMHVMP